MGERAGRTRSRPAGSHRLQVPGTPTASQAIWVVTHSTEQRQTGSRPPWRWRCGQAAKLVLAVNSLVLAR